MVADAVFWLTASGEASRPTRHDRWFEIGPHTKEPLYFPGMTPSQNKDEKLVQAMPSEMTPVAAAVMPTVAATPPVPVVPPVKKRHGCLTALLVLGILFLLFVGGGVGLFFAYQGGYINQVAILNAIGQGYGEMSIVNIRKDAIAALLTPLDADAEELSENALNIDVTGISSFRALKPGRYQLDLKKAAGEDVLGTCTLQIKSGDVYQFVAVPHGVVVTRDSAKTATAQELNMKTSSLCQQ